MRAGLIISVLIPLAGCTSTTGADNADLRVTRDMVAVFPNHCSDGVKDDDETDVDCGGDTCKKCDAGKFCLHGSDCASTICDNNACAGPSCTDKIKNGMETDVDCGGGCPGCPVGKPCLLSSDCASANCVNNLCQPGPCMDQTKNGMETDVDCGGGTCPTCDAGKACLRAADCTSGKCVNNVCQSLVMCMPGTADCDNNAANGCEVNTNTDPKNCGKCAAVCPNNLPICQAGKCAAMLALAGSFLVADGTPVFKQPMTYTCQEACALVFGGAANQYSCSTVMNAVNHQAWLSGWNDLSHCAPNGTPLAEDYKLNTIYSCMNGQRCAYSAYVNDVCVGGFASRNYCFR